MNSQFEIIGHLAYLLVAVSYAARDIFWLRVLAIPACLLGIVFGMNVETGPIWVVVIWNSLFLVINFTQLGFSVFQDIKTMANPDYRRISTLLHPLQRSEIRELLKHSRTRKYEESTIAFREAETPNNLVFIIDGSATVWKSDELIANCGPGSFLGDLSFLARNSCSATVKLNANTKCIEWNMERLRKQLERNPELSSVFFERLAKKVTLNWLETEAELKSANEWQRFATEKCEV